MAYTRNNTLPRSVVLRLRVSVREWRSLRAGARTAQQSLADFMRSAGLDKATGLAVRTRGGVAADVVRDELLSVAKEA